MAKKQQNQKQYIKEAINCALLSAIENNNNEDIDFNLSIGANPAYNNSEAIVLAAMHSNIDVIKKLVDNGADINARLFEAIDYAAYKCKNENLNYLLPKIDLRVGKLNQLFEAMMDGENVKGIEILYNYGHDPMLWVESLNSRENNLSDNFLNACYDMIEKEIRKIREDLANLTKDGFDLKKIRNFEDRRGRNGLILMAFSGDFKEIFDKYKKEPLLSSDLLNIKYNNKNLLEILEDKNYLKDILSPNKWLDNVSGLKNIFNKMTKKQKQFFNPNKILTQTIHQRKLRDIKRLNTKKIKFS